MRPIHNQSHPTTPPGATRTYISVVQGRKMMPSIGQIHHRLPPAKLRKATSQRSGWISYQTGPKIRGPSRASNSNRQHMVRFPYVPSNLAFWAANSSSVRMPWASEYAATFLSACRRFTALRVAVTVPATTAVRAQPECYRRSVVLQRPKRPHLLVHVSLTFLTSYGLVKIIVRSL